MDKIFNRVAQFQQIRTGFVVGLDESRFGLDFAVFTGFYRVFFLGRSQERDWLSSIRVVADSKPSLIDRIWLIFVPFLWSQHLNEERKKNGVAVRRKLGERIRIIKLWCPRPVFMMTANRIKTKADRANNQTCRQLLIFLKIRWMNLWNSLTISNEINV